MRALGAGATVAVVLWTTGALAQSGSVQIATTGQVLTGDPLRLGGQPRLEPDLGLVWTQPGFRFGTLELNAHVVRRRDRPWLGLAFGALRGVKLGGLTWTVQGGDAAVTPSISDYAFTNLFAPRLNLAGLFAEGTSRTTTLTLAAGRVTALRNLFGTDTEALDERVAFAKLRRRRTASFEWSVRASAVQTRRLGEFAYFIDESRQAGGGVRYRPLGLVEFVADGALTAFRRRGMSTLERDASLLAGTLWTLPRGWIQVNAQRLSPGEFPVLHNTLTDRQGAFAAGEYDVTSRWRLFGGVEDVQTNLDPERWGEGSQGPPDTRARRSFGGVRTRLTNRSFVTFRVEDGRRRSVAVPVGRASEAETRLVGVEWQATVGRWTSYGRYHRREHADRTTTAASFLQHDAFAQLYLNLSRGSQVFASGQYTRREAASGGQNLWQATAGGQFQMRQRPLWLRAEGLLTETFDTDTGFGTERQALTLGLFGQLGPRTSITFDLLVDRAPSAILSGHPWTTRSTLRLVHTLPTGSVRVAPAEPRLTVGRPPARGTGAVTGEVFADWNANGVRDPGEEALSGIVLALGTAGRASSGPDGQVRFTDVPVGPARLALDVTALPVDYDVPRPPHADIEVKRNQLARVSFGLVPLGSIRGTVVRDANGNGRADDTDEPIDGAVLVLDGGARSELARGGAFRFDAVPSGAHRLRVLADSLPPGAEIQGDAEIGLELGRRRLDPQVAFLVRLEPRPEVRRVFPPASVPAGAATPGARPATPTPAVPPAAPRPAVTPPPPRPTPTPPVGGAVAPPEAALLQIAAVGRLDRARSLVDDLRARGIDAFVVPPAPAGPDAFYRVRAGVFPNRRAAEQARAALRGTLPLAPVLLPADPSHAAPFRIQVAALAARDRAKQLYERLVALGHAAYLLEPGPASADALVRVRVGPYASRGDADHAADAIARALGMQVWVTSEHPPTLAPGARPRSAPAAAAQRPRRPVPTAPPGGFVVQVAALSNRARAEALAEQLRNLGFRPYVGEPAPGGVDQLFRVGVGPFPRVEDAQQAARAIEAALGTRVWVRPASAAGR